MAFLNDFSLADLHCDTPYELYLRSESFFENSLAVSNRYTNVYSEYWQVAAIWSQKELDNDSAYARFFEIAKYFKNDVLSSKDISIYNGRYTASKKTFILSVEDARILNGDINRLNALYAEGVRIITLLWRGCTCIGGSFDTSSGLTEFGKKTVRKCIELGIVPDISHASEQSAYDVFEMCGDSFPVIASHSCSAAVYDHPRNITDGQFAHISASGGLVGINLYLEPLGLTVGDAAVPSILKHIEHFLSIGGEDIVAFGCDFDGTDAPLDLPNVSSLTVIAEEMLRLNYSEAIVKKLFYKNAKNFIKKYIINKR